MKYAVVIQRRAEEDLNETYLNLVAHRSEADADRWLAEVYRDLATLDRMSERCGLAFESRWVDEPLRQLLIGRNRSCFRSLFIVRGPQVYVLRVRHAAREPLLPRELYLPGDAETDLEDAE